MEEYSLISRGKCSSLNSVNYYDTHDAKANRNAAFPANRDSSFSENVVGKQLNGSVYPNCVWISL